MRFFCSIMPYISFIDNAVIPCVVGVDIFTVNKLREVFPQN